MRKRLNYVEEDINSLVNLTPLIDVVFVVLVTFILIAPMLNLDKVELASGKELKKLPTSFQSRNTITIHVYKDNSIFINQRKVLAKDLTAVLSSLKKNYPKETPKLIHDKSASFGTYQTIKSALETVGFDELDVILKP